MKQDNFEKYYLEIVSDPRFKLFGLTRENILEVKKRMDMWAAKDVKAVLIAEPK